MGLKRTDVLKIFIMKHLILLLIAGAQLCAFGQDTTVIVKKDLYLMSLYELMRLEIRTASNIKENLHDVPATTIVVTGLELEQRGYNNLSELFDDLPGMHMSRPYGDTYYRNYVRGYRTTGGSPMLLLIDGLKMNDLYYNDDEVSFQAIPLSNIERVEIVYGPTSSVYGANASMGVINVITKTAKMSEGISSNINLSHGFFNYKKIDFSSVFKNKNVQLSISGRIEDGNLRDFIGKDRMYWNMDKLYTDQALWGDYINNTELLPKSGFSSPIQNRSLDVRLQLGDESDKFGSIIIGGRYHQLKSGGGTVYPADRLHASSIWDRTVKDFYIQNFNQIHKKVNSQTLLRYFQHEIPNESWDIESFGNSVYDGPDTTITFNNIDYNLNQDSLVRNIAFTFWYASLNKIEIRQDFEVSFLDNLSVLFGGSYVIRDLHKRYDGLDAPAINNPFLLDATESGAYPEIPTKGLKKFNRITWRDQSAYSQLKYTFLKNHILNAGIRLDDNSAYGTKSSFRASYIGHLNDFSLKLLYGEAYIEPSPRKLYGGWQGSGSDPELKPETSNTLELNVGYTREKLYMFVDIYRVLMDDISSHIAGGANNLGHREVLGLDYYIQYNLPLRKIKGLRVWTAYSSIIKQEEDILEETIDNNGNTVYVKTGTGIIGDLSKHAIRFGSTVVLTDKINFTVLARYIGRRETVSTNPLGSIDPYFVTDVNIVFQDILVKGLGFNIKVTNLLNTDYYHPGIKTGDASVDPGTGWTTDGNLIYNGSKGWFNSKLPQFQRFIMLNLSLKF